MSEFCIWEVIKQCAIARSSSLRVICKSGRKTTTELLFQFDLFIFTLLNRRGSEEYLLQQKPDQGRWPKSRQCLYTLNSTSSFCLILCVMLVLDFWSFFILLLKLPQMFLSEPNCNVFSPSFGSCLMTE